MNHATIWAAIDMVAIRLRMTRSGLARHCGMDATAFNKSKRFDKYGKPHWPSCITVSKVMLFAHLSPEEFGRIISEAEHDLAQQNGNTTWPNRTATPPLRDSGGVTSD